MLDVLERLFRLARAHLNAGRDTDWQEGGATWDTAGPGAESFRREEAPTPQDRLLAGYYANLEVPYGSDLETVRRAWKRMLKKYHPDLHGDDPEKRRIANELTSELTRAYRELEKALAGGKRG